MKASLKFRDEQKPIIRAKVPLSILGLPFQSGIVAGESKELTLNLGTLFESGPAVRISYRPNDSWNPFSLVVKTGTGPFGSPIASSMSMSAEFNLINKGNPNFMLHFKPNFGDFSVKKSQSSVLKAVSPIEDDASIEVVEVPRSSNGGYGLESSALFGKRSTAALAPGSPVGLLSSALSGMEVAARTVVPVKNRALMSCRWGVRIPGHIGNGFNPSEGIKLLKIPFLVMNKIGIEHVPASAHKKEEPKRSDQGAREMKAEGGVDLAETCFSMRRHLDIMQSENSQLRQAIEDLRQEFAARKSNPLPHVFDSGKYLEAERSGNRASSGKIDRRNNEKKSTDSGAFAAKSMEEDVSEELKKALKGAGGA